MTNFFMKKIAYREKRVFFIYNIGCNRKFDVKCVRNADCGDAVVFLITPP